MNKSHFMHALAALSIQMVIGRLMLNWWAGAAAGTFFFIGREHAQAEYHWIKQFGEGRRENMPWWGGFDPRAWTRDGLLDWGVPAVAVLVVAFAAM